jgi:hypothetical protein
MRQTIASWPNNCAENEYFRASRVLSFSLLAGDGVQCGLASKGDLVETPARD